MTKEHILECRWASQRCICEELRACEQRVREDMALQYLVSDREQQESEDRAYAAGLDAAREAVNALAPTTVEFHGPLPVVHNVMITAALAAIDELRNPPPLPPTTGRAHKY